ncbi:MAG: eukaryotic-like serine/threonine-protein kinase [Solirubrobacteraceae bacterium]|nr:eukaryotic-like serine/threonine-protein kinase [Solirubrobacteraceae bacterium]
MLARGGMAVVYLVRQPALDREVVLKRLDLESDDPTIAQRFVGEARLAAKLDHPNVVTLFDFFEHDGVPYIAMEYVAGGSLRSLIGTLELPQVFALLEGALAGLAHAEHHGIAHRDLKPENVLVTPRGNVKIADFGIARAYNALSQRLTVTGRAMGTPAYMSPEQALNEPIGPSTDLYALGVIVYELLAGRTPFDADTPVGVLYCHVHKPPPPLADLAPSAPPAVREWVHWLLAKAPRDRPRSATQAWDALEEIAVAELGPYWRRAAAITAPGPVLDTIADDAELTTTEESIASPATPKRTPRLPPPTPVAVPRPPPSRPRRRLGLVAAAAGVAGAIAAVVVASQPDEPTARRAAATPPRNAVPYDFNGDGRQELVIALLRASPRGDSQGSGVVLVHEPPHAHPAWRVITEATAGLPGRPRSSDGFGSGLASGDFDHDGWTDLAIGTPGKSRVSVLYGRARGLTGGRTQQFAASGLHLPPGAGGYGFVIHARDLDDDGFDDLVVGAPGAPRQRAETGTGALQLLFGGNRGLGAARARTIRRPPGATTGFGTRLRVGDIDGDHHADLVEGAPNVPSGPGHASYCPGTARGPRSCRVFGPASGTSSLAVADLNGDHYADIVQGDSAHAQVASGFTAPPGEVRLWLGSRGGPRPSPIRITQNTPAIPGEDEPGDEFGAVVEAGDVDSDGFADIVVGAKRENEGAGRITVIRGGRSGYATTGNSSFDQDRPGVPGNAEPDAEFGGALTILSLTGDRRLDVAIAAQGRHAADERVMVVHGGPGVFAPDETRTSTLAGVASLVHAPRGGRIRLARMSGG